MKTTVLIPGSYDPVTLGHLSIIDYAAKTADKVYAAIFINPDKTYRFPLDARRAFLRQACRDYPNVQVLSSSATVAEFAAAHGVSYLLKGVRNEADFLYEREMADVNRTRGVQTLFLPALPELREISSSALRRALDTGADLSPYLPSSVLEMVQKYRP